MATVTYSFTSGSYAGTADGVITGTDLAVTGLTLATNASLGYSTGTVAQLSGGGQSLDPAKYATVTLTNTAGGSWNLSGLTLKAARGGSTNPRGFFVRTSVDSYATSLSGGGAIGTVRPNWTTFTIDTSTLGTLTGPLTVRIYQYAPASTATIELDDIVFTGAPVGSGTSYSETVAASSGSTLTGAGQAGAALTVSASSGSTLAGSGSATARSVLSATSGSALAATANVYASATIAATSQSNAVAPEGSGFSTTLALSSGSTLNGQGRVGAAVQAVAASGSTVTGTARLATVATLSLNSGSAVLAVAGAASNPSDTLTVSSGSSVAGAGRLGASGTGVAASGTTLSLEGHLSAATDVQALSGSTLTGAAHVAATAALDLSSSSTLLLTVTAPRAADVTVHARLHVSTWRTKVAQSPHRATLLPPNIRVTEEASCSPHQQSSSVLV